MDEIILAIYDVAAGLVGWRQLCATLAEALDSDNLAVFLFDERSGGLDLLATTGVEDRGRIETYRSIALKMAARPGDVSRPEKSRLQQRAAAGPATGEGARWSSLSESGVDCYAAGMALDNLAEGLWFCVGLGGAGSEVAAEAYEKVERLLPHFCRAAKINRSLSAATGRSSFSDMVFDRLPFGLMQVDRNAMVTYANAEAERISRLREGFTIASGRVRAGSAADDAILQGAIRDAIGSSEPATLRWINVKRSNGRRPYRLLVTSSSDKNEGGYGPLCAVLVADPERPAAITPEAIADAFGLTTAEARVVARLATGSSLPDIAGNLKVSINTVRTLLARAMGKTATNTQVALVRMVLTTFSLVG